MVNNLSERADNPRYSFIARTNNNTYLDAFSIQHINLTEALQHPSFYQSIREINDSELNALSDAIVQQLQQYTAQRGHPPLSMAEYLNAGLLEDAINAVPSLNQRRSDTDLIPRHSPAHIAQTTIMNAISAFAFVRSDSFKLRSYGAATHPTDGSILSEAYLEAYVQRTAEPHREGLLGRKFKILSIQRIPPIR